MFINPSRFISLSPTVREMPEILKIKKYKRIIYISDEPTPKDANPNNIFSSSVKRTVILTNLSKSRTSNETTKIIKSTYVFRCYKNVFEEDNFNESTLYLERMLTTGYELYKGTRIDLGITLSEGFSDEYQYPTSININDIFNESLELENRESLSLIDPRYYTELHQEYETGNEFITLPQIGKSSWKGEELIDLNTEMFKIENETGYTNNFKVRNENELIPVSKDKNLRILEHKMYIEDIPIRLFIISQMSFLSAYQLHWDSKYKGCNLVDVYRPKGFIRDEKIIEDTRMIESIITKIGNKLKKIFGDIRIMYYFSQFEERITVIFDNDEISSISMRLSKENLFERVLVASNQEAYATLISNFQLSRDQSYDN